MQTARLTNEFLKVISCGGCRYKDRAHPLILLPISERLRLKSYPRSNASWGGVSYR
jgi:hypothetical protein